VRMGMEPVQPERFLTRKRTACGCLFDDRNLRRAASGSVTRGSAPCRLRQAFSMTPIELSRGRPRIGCRIAGPEVCHVPATPARGRTFDDQSRTSAEADPRRATALPSEAAQAPAAESQPGTQKRRRFMTPLLLDARLITLLAFAWLACAQRAPRTEVARAHGLRAIDDMRRSPRAGTPGGRSADRADHAELRKKLEAAACIACSTAARARLPSARTVLGAKGEQPDPQHQYRGAQRSHGGDRVRQVGRYPGNTDENLAARRAPHWSTISRNESAFALKRQCVVPNRDSPARSLACLNRVIGCKMPGSKRRITMAASRYIRRSTVE